MSNKTNKVIIYYWKEKLTFTLKEYDLILNEIKDLWI